MGRTLRNNDFPSPVFKARDDAKEGVIGIGWDGTGRDGHSWGVDGTKGFLASGRDDRPGHFIGIRGVPGSLQCLSDFIYVPCTRNFTYPGPSLAPHSFICYLSYPTYPTPSFAAKFSIDRSFSKAILYWFISLYLKDVGVCLHLTTSNLLETYPNIFIQTYSFQSYLA